MEVIKNLLLTNKTKEINDWIQTVENNEFSLKTKTEIYNLTISLEESNPIAPKCTF